MEPYYSDRDSAAGAQAAGAQAAGAQAAGAQAAGARAARAQAAGGVHVILDNVRSAFNVGSIFRTADAAGIGCLHLCGITCWPPHPKLEKTSLGAHQYVPWRRHESTEEALRALRAQGVPVAALETHPEARVMGDFVWPRPVGLVLGHEVVGVSEEVLALCDFKVRIPMFGRKNSLNVASAFAVVAYHLVGC